jgi:hypothetical protein
MIATAKAVIKAYDAVTHTATVQLVGSTPSFLAAVPVAANVHAADCVAGRTCALLFFDSANPSDAVITAVIGLPAAAGGIPNYIADLDTDTFVHTEYSADEDKLHGVVAMTERLLLQTASPHIQLTGDLKVTGYVALAGGTPSSPAYLSVSPNGVTFPANTTLINMAPTSCSVPIGGSFWALAANATVSINTGATPAIKGLNFVGFVTGLGSPTEVSGVAAQVGCMSLAGTIADLHALYAVARYITFTGGGGVTRSHGLRIANQGKAGVGTTFGLLIEPQLDSAACYSIWAGATYAGTPRLRLDEGTPGAGQTMLNLAEGVTPTVRRVQWVDPGAGGANLVAGQRVMILV